MVVALAGVLCLAGCFQTVRMRPDAAAWRNGVRTVAIVPSVHVYEVSAGEVREQKEQWTAQAEKNVTDALGSQFRERGLRVKVLKARGDEELDDVKLLYEAVGVSIRQFAYPPFASPYKVEHFDYSVGPVDRILDRAGADVLLIAHARDSNSTTARKLTSFLRAANEYAIVTLGLVDRRGRVVWFDLWGGRSLDLRNEPDVRQIVQHLLANLPETAK